MAKKQSLNKEKKEAAYVVSTLEITYTIPIGLTGMLAQATKSNNKEVWCQLSDMANVCAARILSRMDMHSNSRYGTAKDSWTTQKFPGSEIKLRLDMTGHILTQTYDLNTRTYMTLEFPKKTFHCRVKVSGSSNEKFTQAQIDDYITEKILLGDDDELTGIADNSEQVDKDVHLTIEFERTLYRLFGLKYRFDITS